MPNSATDFDRVRTPAAKHDMHCLQADAKPFHDPDSPDLAALIKSVLKRAIGGVEERSRNKA
jgi:hypothetical protein